MRIVGLTGGIASGKTLVSDTFAKLGAPIVDADVLAREVVEPGSVGLTGLVDLFSEDILTRDDTLDRAELRFLIFNDDSARAQVDALLHPLIRNLSEVRIKEQAALGKSYVIHAIPLLVETDQQARYDSIVVVDVPVELQLQRLMARDDTSEADAQRIIESQATREQRLAVATDVIDNSGRVDTTIAQVEELHQRFNLPL